MVVSSRFKEHFEIIEQDPFQEPHIYTASNCSNSNKPYHSPQIYIDQQEYDLRRQSLSNTIDTIETISTTYSINRQCYLKRQSRVRTRRHKREDSNGGSSLTSSVSNNSIVGWCLKQKSKISTKLRHL